MKHLISLLAALGLSASLLSAQDNIGIPADVFYLMPKMAQGTLLFRDKSPVTGQFNICAVDNTVRFKNKGTELAMEEDESLLEVIIDQVPFLHRDGCPDHRDVQYARTNPRPDGHERHPLPHDRNRRPVSEGILSVAEQAGEPSGY